jgi:hypothetical protein
MLEPEYCEIDSIYVYIYVCVCVCVCVHIKFSTPNFSQSCLLAELQAYR